MVTKRAGRFSVALGLLIAAAAVTGSSKDKSRTCCFNHVGFASSCKVQLSKDETCASVLTYLNDPNSSGKSYCANTTLRGGWTQVDCKPPER
jgi:hypothetical protein